MTDFDNLPFMDHSWEESIPEKFKPKSRKKVVEPKPVPKQTKKASKRSTRLTPTVVSIDRKIKPKRTFIDDIDVSKDTLMKNNNGVPKQVPANQDILALGSDYTKHLPAFLGPNIERVRDFLLQEVFPVALSFTSGIQDSVEIARQQISADFDVGPLRGFIEDALRESLDLKALSLVANVTNLSKKESQLLFARHFLRTIPANSNGGQEIVKTIMSALLSVGDVQRQAKGEGLQLREVSAVKASRRHKSALRSGSGAGGPGVESSGSGKAWNRNYSPPSLFNRSF